MAERFAAVILTDAPTQLAGDRIVARIAEEFPAMKPEDLTSRSKTPEGGLVVRAGGAAVTIRQERGPLTPNQLNRAIATSVGWVEAREHVERHAAHVIVAPMLEHELKTALSLAAITTATTAAVAAECGATAVYWAQADLLVEPTEFRRASQAVLSGTPPLSSWVKFMPIKGKADHQGATTTGFVTAGFKTFVGREIEFEPVARERREIGSRMLGFMNYLLSKGPIVNHGDTIGVSDSERIRVALDDKNPFTGTPVYRLSVEVLAPGESAETSAAASDIPPPPPPPSSTADPFPTTAEDGPAPSLEDASPASEAAFAPEPETFEEAAPTEETPDSKKSGSFFGGFFGKKR